MNVRDWRLPFRVGATSYIVENDLVANATFLAQHVQDMQLVLFDIPDGLSNLPDAATVARLAEIGAHNDLTYTVHLIADLLADDLAAWERSPAAQPGAPLHPSLRIAQAVIEQTRALAPWAWVGHLDGRAVRERGFADLATWRVQSTGAVAQVCTWAGRGERLAIENLEGYPPDFVMPVVAATQAARCVDVGHLWLDDHDPLQHLQAAWARLRVIHLHGVTDRRDEQNRDHRSLALMTPQRVDSVLHLLLRRGYTGVLTLEIFGEADFWSSLHALEASLRRYRGEWAWIDT